MNQPPFFSIIIPVYNVEKFITPCVQSILSQDFIDFELVLIEDYSTDTTYSIIKELALTDSRIKLFQNDANSGVSFSRNRGMDRAIGQYVFFIDSDDQLAHASVLSAVYKILKENAVDILDFNFNKITGGNSSVHGTLAPYKDSVCTGLEYLDKTYSVSTTVWNKVYKTAFLKSKSLVFAQRRYEDVSFVLDSFTKAEKVLFADLALYNYYINANSIMTSKVTVDKLEDVNKLILDLEEIYQQHRENPHVHKVFLYSFVGFARLWRKFDDKKNNLHLKNEMMQIFSRYRKDVISNVKMNVLIKVFLVISPFLCEKLIEFKEKIKS